MVIFLFWVLCVVLVYILARDKNRDVVPWLILAMCFAPVVLIAILFCPKVAQSASPQHAPALNTTSTGIKAELNEIRNELASLGAKLNKLESKLAAADKTGDIVEEPLRMPYAAPVVVEKSDIPKERKDVEIDLGKFWLNKAGIIIFSLGIGFLITYTFKYFGPFLKIMFGYLVSGILFFWGSRLEKKNKFVNYGRVLLGGAWAIAYFTTYAMYHFNASKIINSQVLDLILLTIV
ncbi:MAG: DUF2339 domain-containing protein, partial [Candidatus Omnitrophota bacterium]